MYLHFIIFIHYICILIYRIIFQKIEIFFFFIPDIKFPFVRYYSVQHLKTYHHGY